MVELSQQASGLFIHQFYRFSLSTCRLFNCRVSIYIKHKGATPARRAGISTKNSTKGSKTKHSGTFFLVGLTGLTVFGFYQWHEAQKNTINALAETSEASLLSNRQLEALVSAVKSGKQLQNPLLFLAPDASQTASAALQRAVYNVQERNRLEGHSSVVTSVVFSPDGKSLASGNADKTVKLWDVATGKVINPLNGHSSQVLSVVFSPDGKTLASGSADKTVKLWDIATGKEINTLHGHSDEVTSIAFSPDGKTLTSGSFDKTVKLWNFYPNNLNNLMTLSCD